MKPRAGTVGSCPDPGERCLSCPRSRSCAAGCGPVCAASCSRRGSPRSDGEPTARGRAGGAAGGPPRGGAAAPRQVPDRGSRRRSAGRAPAHDRPAALHGRRRTSARRACACSSTPATSLYFYDVRRFGARVGAPAGARKRRSSPAWAWSRSTTASSPPALRALMAGRRAPLKAFLLDQRRIAGVGNIYADEALFRARLHPLRPAGDVGPREAQRLHAAVVETLQVGIDHEGSSVESFVDPAGERGRFRRSSTSTSARASRVASAARRSAASDGGRPRHALLPALPAAALGRASADRRARALSGGGHADAAAVRLPLRRRHVRAAAGDDHGRRAWAR